MGEYHTRRNQDGGYTSICKVGTCDDWRYVRRSEVEAMAQHDAGEQTDMGWALNPGDNGPAPIFRFPFPYEDQKEGRIEHIQQRNMFETIEFQAPAAIMGLFEHQEMVKYLEPAGKNAWGANVWIPCPMTDKFTLRANPIKPVLSIYGERYDDKGNPRTIFACAWCGSIFAITEDELPDMRNALRQSGLAGIADRITARATKPAEQNIEGG
jgi:hypothetical protein